ncbi:MAG: hypothetical protein V4490_01450, partial [Pseudomonadota bacterium]
RHNLNYWQYGDYLGIGAGAHAKITRFDDQTIVRQIRQRQPTAYLTAESLIQSETLVPANERLFEFMLNSLRLTQGIPKAYFSQRTGLPLSEISAPLQQAIDSGWLISTDSHWTLTETGQNFLNDVVALFLRES